MAEHCLHGLCGRGWARLQTHQRANLQLGKCGFATRGHNKQRQHMAQKVTMCSVLVAWQSNLSLQVRSACAPEDPALHSVCTASSRGSNDHKCVPGRKGMHMAQLSSSLRPSAWLFSPISCSIVCKGPSQSFLHMTFLSTLSIGWRIPAIVAHPCLLCLEPGSAVPPRGLHSHRPPCCHLALRQWF